MTEPGILISLLVGAGIPAGVHGATFAVMRRYVSGDPMRMIRANVAAFVVRLTLYGTIIAAAVTWMNLRPWAFVVSFAAFFVFLQLMEAVYFNRLLLRRKTQ